MSGWDRHSSDYTGRDWPWWAHALIAIAIVVVSLWLAGYIRF